MLRRFALGLTGVGTAAAVAASQDEGLKRSHKFWAVAFPIFLHYRWVQWRVADSPEVVQDEAFTSLHKRYAPVAEDLTWKLKGFYLKQAQFISTLSDDFLPKEYMTWMKKTQDEVPSPFEPGEARKTVEHSLGVPLDEVFRSFEDEPMGAASIGQVHRAVLKDGRKVVVKVQYPGIEAMFRSDLATTITFCKLAMKQHVGPMQEIEKQFVTEFDYMGEARNMEEMHTNLAKDWSDRVVIPRPVMELCRKDVLVMDELPGQPLVKGIRDNYKAMAALQGTTLEAMEEEMKEEVRKGTFKLKDADEEAAKIKRAQKMLYTIDLLKNTPRAAWNWSLGLVGAGRYEYKWTPQPLNLGSILRTLSEVHAYQIFHDGVFNGDPHPGNILLMPDGRLGLIDYGQVKRWTLDQRLAYAELIVALADGDRDEIVRAFRDELKVRTERCDPDILYRLACFWNDRNTDDITNGLNLQEFQDWAQAEDPGKDMPNWPVIASRVNVLMRGMGNAFGLHLTIADQWAPFAKQVLEEHGPAGGRAVDVPDEELASY